MQVSENDHLTSRKHKSHLLNFFLALSQKSAYYSFPAPNGQRWEAFNQKSGTTKLFEGQVTASPPTLGACSWLSCPASVALLMQANAHCWGLPTGLSVHVCLHVKACTTTASLKGCSSASSCAHTKAACEFLPVGVQKAPACAHLTAWLWNPPAKIPGKACGVLWGLAHFCMYVPGNQDTLQSCYRSLPVCPHFIRPLDEAT